jgi:hypothetical protein
MSTIEFTIENDGGEEITIELPARFEVCSRCDGHGTHLTESIGSHAYSMEEFAEEFSDDESRDAYFQRGGMYDVTCTECGGKRVALVVDEAKCTTAALKADLAAYEEHLANEARFAAQDRHEREMGY